MTHAFANILHEPTTTSAPLIIDGAMGTALEAAGVDLSHALWSAQLLQDAPDTITKIHRDYIAAGARIITTVSYQATPLGFADQGMTETEGRELVMKSVDVAAEARATTQAVHPVLIAGSVGPYGAALGNGAEYRGDYCLTHEELADFHRPRLESLVSAGVDLLAVETQPSLPEIEVLAGLVTELRTPAWLSVTLADGRHLADGTALSTLAEMVAGHPYIHAVGVNCVPPSLVSTALETLAEVTDLPLIAYPNSGEIYDAQTMEWCEDASSFPVREWAASGAQIIGGCCRTTPADIAALTQELRDNQE